MSNLHLIYSTFSVCAGLLFPECLLSIGILCTLKLSLSRQPFKVSTASLLLQVRRLRLLEVKVEQGR